MRESKPNYLEDNKTPALVIKFAKTRMGESSARSTPRYSISDLQNYRPDERPFLFSRRARAGTGLPSWLLEEESEVLLRRFVRDKSKPLCDVVKLLMANPTYARIRRKDVKETTVSTFDLVPYPQVSPSVDVDKANNGDGESSEIDLPLASETEQDQPEKSLDKTVSVEDNLFREEPTI